MDFVQENAIKIVPYGEMWSSFSRPECEYLCQVSFWTYLDMIIVTKFYNTILVIRTGKEWAIVKLGTFQSVNFAKNNILLLNCAVHKTKCEACTVKVWETKSNFASHLIMVVINHAC